MKVVTSASCAEGKTVLSAQDGCFERQTPSSGLLKNISRSRVESSRRTGVKAARNRGYAVTSDSAVLSGKIFLSATKNQPTG